MRYLVVNKDKCKICNICQAIEHCPAEAIIPQFEEPPYIDDCICINCGKCVNVCPHNAINWFDDGKFELNKFARKLK